MTTSEYTSFGFHNVQAFETHVHSIPAKCLALIKIKLSEYPLKMS